MLVDLGRIHPSLFSLRIRLRRTFGSYGGQVEPCTSPRGFVRYRANSQAQRSSSNIQSKKKHQWMVFFLWWTLGESNSPHAIFLTGPRHMTLRRAPPLLYAPSGRIKFPSKTPEPLFSSILASKVLHQQKRPTRKWVIFVGGPWENRTPARRMQTGCTTTMLTARVASELRFSQPRATRLLQSSLDSLLSNYCLTSLLSAQAIIWF